MAAKMDIDPALILQTVQVLSIVAGIVVSFLTWSWNRRRDAEQRAIESRKPFLELRQRLYVEALQAAGVLATPELHDERELIAARKRFSELYWAELCLVEDPVVEKAMIRAGKVFGIDQSEQSYQLASYELAHSLRDSLQVLWGVRGHTSFTQSHGRIDR